MKIKIRSVLTWMVPVLIFSSVRAQNNSALPRSLPEAEGVSSAGILRFVQAAEKSNNELHSFMVLRHGKVIAEGWWDPYKPGLRQSLYSASKTFTSTAIGLAVSENKIKLTDPVISFFPKELPDSVSANLKALTIRDLLIMSDGMDPEPTNEVTAKSKNWVNGFLHTPVIHPPGTLFLYNSLGTFMLSAILQKVTGQKLIDYLKPRLFQPLGITGMDWEETLLSVNTGGWGLRLKTEDMAKLGQLYLQKGIWNGSTLIPAAWIEEATTAKIYRTPGLEQVKKDSSDWEQGYGYQIWRCRHHAFRADGAYGQYIIVMPDQDAVVAIQAETKNMQDEINLVWNYLLPAFKKVKSLPADQKSAIDLKVKLASLAIPPQTGSASTLLANKVFNKNFILEPNDLQIGSLVIQIKDSICHIALNNGTDVFNLAFGSGYWKPGQTNKQGPSLFAKARENNALLLPLQVRGNFYWQDDHTLIAVLRYIESPHTETMTFHFDGEKISIDVAYSLHFGEQKIELTGVQK